jgi:hypothetical protein
LDKDKGRDKNIPINTETIRRINILKEAYQEARVITYGTSKVDT